MTAHASFLSDFRHYYTLVCLAATSYNKRMTFLPMQTPLMTRLNRPQQGWWHMPGHAGRLNLPAMLDTTELRETDDLRHPGPAILAMREAMAAREGAAVSLPLCGGATLGIQAMIGGMAPRGKTLLVAPGAHLSAYHACALFGVRALAWQLGDEAPPDAAGLLVTTPDYFGVCADLAPYRAAAQRLGVPLLLDAAHAAHFAYCADAPQTEAGCAQAWVHSAHKTLPVLTGGAWLHLADACFYPDVWRALLMVMTTSPSFLILASLESARAYMEDEGIRRMAWLAERAGQTTLAWNGAPRDRHCDPARVVLEVAHLGMTGREALERLGAYGIDGETADEGRVALIGSVLLEEDDFAQMHGALARLRGDTAREMPRRGGLQLEAAVGRIAQGWVGLYPPGVPLIRPGETITPEAVGILMRASADGARVFGLVDGVIPAKAAGEA